VQTDRSRAALSEFLRSRRQRIAPDHVGLPTGTHRRTSGLRREEVAVLTGISPTWYTYLEQGRDIRPSNEVLDNLAQVLQMNADERVYLYLLVNGQRPPAVAEAPAAPEDETLRRFVALAEGAGLPMIGHNGYLDITCWNAAAARWYTDFDQIPEERRNLLWWQLTDPAARERLVDWDEDTSDLVARLRIASAERPWDSRFTELVDRLQQASTVFRFWWEEHDVHEQPARYRRLRGPDGEVHEMELVVLRTANSFNSLMLHLPIDAVEEPFCGGVPGMQDAGAL